MDTTGLLRVRIFTPSLLVQHGIILLSFVGTVVLQSCSGIVNLSENGTLKSPGYPLNNYQSYSVCQWNITVAEGFVAVLRFGAFRIESCSNCGCDYVEAYDGPDALSPKLTRVCGSDLPSPIYASQNKMFVKFISDSSVTYSGFTATIGQGEVVTQFIESDNGTIQSPNYPNNYDRDMRYVWNITVPENHQIFLEFLTFELEASVNCAKDFVQVKDGYQAESPVLGKICGTNAVKYMKSTENSMTIAFQTDDSQEARGFVAKFRKVEKCGTTITGTSGNFNSPNYPNNYGPVERCLWKIAAPEDHHVLLRFLTFNVANSNLCTKDYVKIYNGNDTSAASMGTFCGSGVPNISKSTSSEILVVFESDADEEAKGFSARFETDLCGEEFYTDSGTFHSPNYPGSYGSHEMCSWKVTVADGYRVAIRFDSSKLEDSYRCNADSVRVFDGLNTSSPELTKFCGESSLKRKVYSSGNTISVRFVTDASYSKTGFSASFVKAQIPPSGNTTSPASPCQQSITSDTGTISSPRYPEWYGTNMDCLWNIEVAEGNVIRLEFQSFDVEEGTYCNFDFVRIHDGNSTNSRTVGTYCGTDKPETLWSSGNELTVRFTSDGSFDHPGFSATYSKVDNNKEILSGDKGILKSPNFPNNYGPVQRREWEITVPEGHIIFLRFLSFELEYSQNCSDDFVYVTDIDGDGLRVSFSRRFCGAAIPNDMRTSSNKLTVIFATDTSEELSGFSAKYEKEVICGSDSCRNGGACIRGSKGDSRCSCKHGYAGPLCDEKVLCSSDTCEHGGTCSQNGTDGLFYCTCTHGYEGAVCHERILCGSDICENGGTCTHGGKDGTLLCACAPDFEGLFCEKVVEKSSGTVVAIVVPLIAVLVIATAAILFFLIRRRMKQQPYDCMKKQGETFFDKDETTDS